MPSNSEYDVKYGKRGSDKREKARLQHLSAKVGQRIKMGQSGSASEGNAGSAGTTTLSLSAIKKKQSNKILLKRGAPLKTPDPPPLLRMPASAARMPPPPPSPSLPTPPPTASLSTIFRRSLLQRGISDQSSSDGSVNMEKLGVSMAVRSTEEFRHKQIVHHQQSIIDPVRFHQVKGVRRLVNVYRPMYKGGERANGLGDFLRGCFYLLQFCEKTGIACDIWFDHPMASRRNSPSGGGGSSGIPVEKCHETNWHYNVIDESSGRFTQIVRCPEESTLKWWEYLWKQPVFASRQGGVRTMYVSCILFPNDTITPAQRTFVRQRLEQAGIDNRKKEAKEAKETREDRYGVLQLRLGDHVLGVQGDKDLSVSALNEIKKKCRALADRFLPVMYIMSDCDAMRTRIHDFLSKHIPQTVWINTGHHAIHLGTGEGGGRGGGREEMDKAIQDTVADFQLLSQSSRIVSLSVYKHGSGFSKWCAETYCIPCECYYVGND